MTFPNCPFPIPKLFWVSSQISSDLLYGGCVSGSVLLYGISFYRFLWCGCSFLVVFLWVVLSYPGFVLPWVMAYRRSDCFVVLFWEMAGSRLFVFLCVKTSCYLGKCVFKPCPVCFPQFWEFEVTLLLGDGRYGIISLSFLSCAWGKLDGVFRACWGLAGVPMPVISRVVFLGFLSLASFGWLYAGSSL